MITLNIELDKDIYFIYLEYVRTHLGQDGLNKSWNYAYLSKRFNKKIDYIFDTWEEGFLMKKLKTRT